MNKHQETRDFLEEAVKGTDTADPHGLISVPVSLLQEAIRTIDTWKMIGEEFALSISVTQGEVKPRIAVDIERFLAAQFTYKQEADGIQQGI
jgi:hypothetical protein